MSKRKPKTTSGLEPWQENCRTCKHFLLVHLLDDGKDNGSVRMICPFFEEDVQPMDIDGCKHYEYGEHRTERREKTKKRENQHEESEPGARD